MSTIQNTQPVGDATSAGGDDGTWLSARTGPGGYRTDVIVRGHAFVADEPASVGGSDNGPTPYDYLLAALGACTSMTLRMYASRKGWPLEEAVVRLRNARSHAADGERRPLPDQTDHRARTADRGGRLGQRPLRAVPGARIVGVVN